MILISKRAYYFNACFLARHIHDYEKVISMLIFESGSNTRDARCVNIAIVDDEALENDETFSLLLSADLDVMLIRNATMLTIKDNDGKNIHNC